ncbi:MAG: FAD-binding oxidoreductase [Gammaproteobacteria bacterium]
MTPWDLPVALRELQEQLGESSVLSRPEEMAGYERGTRYGSGRAACVVRPADVAQVQAVVHWARRHSLRLIAQGANTGLVAAASPEAVGDQVIVSLERMRHTTELDADNRTVRVSAGVLLQTLNARLAEAGLWFPIDLGANPSIGGMIAANTGGTRLLRYGDVRHNLLGLEVVLADESATHLELMSGLRKDNSGLDIKQLFVGTSGVFGIIVAAVLEAHPLPRQQATALLVPRDASSALDLLRRTESRFGELLSSFEVMSRAAMGCVFRFQPRVRNPFEGGAVPEQAILLELACTLPRTSSFDLQQMLEEFLAELLEDEAALLSDALLGKDEQTWALRHAISESLREAGKVIAFDISVRRSALQPFREAAIAGLARLWPYLKVCDFGHFGDGGLHFNVVWPHDCGVEPQAQTIDAVRDFVYRMVVEEFGGSFSAEHGIGPYNLGIYRQFTPLARQRLAGELQRVVNPERLLGTFHFGPAF